MVQKDANLPQPQGISSTFSLEAQQQTAEQSTESGELRDGNRSNRAIIHPSVKRLRVEIRIHTRR
jgi:hypothetical protein